MMKIFKDRHSAGELLAKRLKNTRAIKNSKADLVLGIPRGGVVVAAEIAKELSIPLDTLVVRKIGAPMQEELALGAVDPDGEVVLDESLIRQFQISNIKYQIEKEQKEVRRRESIYRQGKGPLNVENKTVILIDDGIATGATTQAAINYLKRHSAKKIILAMPVASKEAYLKFSNLVDEAIILEIPQYFQAVGQFYQNFPQVSDQEVVSLLK